MEIEKESLETALRRSGREGTVERVVSMTTESALPKGENYLSTIYRVTLRVVLGNGRTAKKSLILKVVPREKAKVELVKNMGVFKSETLMYTTVLKEMEMLMEEFGDTNDILWCKLVHYEPYSAIVLEDLKASGFRMTRRQDCLDLEHSLLVLRSLGRFHGMSKILEERGIISKDDYKPYALVSDPNLIKYFMYYGLQTLAKAMEEHWGPEWYDIAQKLNIPCDVLQEKMLKLGEVDETRFNCLNHGDCWSNNMMFKYDWQNRPYTMRFVDFSEAEIVNPCYELSDIIYISVQPEVRRKSFKDLIRCYHKSLSDVLDFYRYVGMRPSEEDIFNEMDRISFHSFLDLINFFPAVTSNRQEFIDLCKKPSPYYEDIYYDLSLKEKIGPDILRFCEKKDLI